MTRANYSRHATLTKNDFAMLREVVAENVTWRENIAGSRSFRLWSSEHDYTTCTPRLKRLVSMGFVETERAAGYTFANKGPVVLSAKGRRAASPNTQEAGNV